MGERKRPSEELTREFRGTGSDGCSDSGIKDTSVTTTLLMKSASENQRSGRTKNGASSV
jgi:hypothetical protein